MEAVGRMVGEGERVEEGVVSIDFLPVEIDVEFEAFHEAAEGGGLRFGDESVSVSSPDGEQGEVELIAKAVIEQGL